MERGTPAVLSVFDVEPRFIGGTETYARELSLQLGRHGWHSVLCFVTPPSEDVRRFLELPNVSLEVVADLQGPKPGVMWGLARILRRYRPELVHFHYTGFLSPYPWVARILSADRVFFTDHASRPANYRSRRASLLKRCLGRAMSWPVSTVICVSGYGYRCFTERGLFPAGRCAMIYNGVDLDRVVESTERAGSFRRRFSIPGDRKIVLQISWIIPEKGILDLLAAARVVASRNPEAHFVIVGEGPFREEYTRRASELGLREHVTFTGLLEDPFSDGAYDAADVVCQVSRWEEVFGWVIAEAMAYRRPVIATRVGGIPEVVAHDESGWLIERGDVEGLAQNVLLLLEDPARRQAMGMAGRKRVEAKFSLRKNVAQLVETYGIGKRTGTEVVRK
jgi:glycosyltransferase involved in cell wall biosynthesis